MKNVVFSTNVFSIDEADGLNTARVERSFTEALELMINRKGMFILANRKCFYTANKKRIVEAKKAIRIVFGQNLSFELALQNFPNHPDLLWLQGKEISDVVFNKKLCKFVSLEKNDILIEEEKIEEMIQQKSWQKSKDAVPIVEDVRIDMSVHNQLKSFAKTSTVSNKIRTFLMNNEIDFLIIYKIVYYSDGTVIIDEKNPHFIYRNDALVSRDWVMNHYSSQTLARKSCFVNTDDECFIYDVSTNSFSKVPPIATFVSDKILENWSKRL